MIVPLGIDLFHGDVVAPDGFAQLKAAGFAFVIHKATQGLTTYDKQYAARRVQAKAVGLLWGAYDFNTGDDPVDQVNRFLDVAEPDASTRLWLDFEDNRASPMTYRMACTYLNYIDERTAKLGVPMCGVYGGNRIKELVPAGDTVFAKRPLWLCQYKLGNFDSLDALKPHIDIPRQWKNWTLLQYTGDGIGPLPHNAPGVVTHGVDLNVFDGTAEQLAAWWTDKAIEPAAA